MNTTTLQAPKTKVVPYANDHRISLETRAFLNVLNISNPPELEKLSPEEAREVLVNAQASVNVDLSGKECTA